MRASIRWIITAGLAAALLVGPLFINHLVGRPDRIAAAARRDALLSVKDEVLRFEHEHGRLPKTLEELVPKYLQGDDIQRDGKPLYRYSRDMRVLAEPEGSLVRGLISYRLPPFIVQLPPPEPGPSIPTPREPLTTAAIEPEQVPTTETPEAPETQPQPAQIPPKPPEVETPAAPEPTPPMPEPPVPAEAFTAGIMVVPKGPVLPEAPAASLVFEAEHYSDTNYGWEVHPDDTCSGGAYLHCKEGIANGPGQKDVRVGNFYDVNATTEHTYLRYHFHLPEEGNYYLYGRMWTTDTHCSNALHVAVDTGDSYIGTMGNRDPFRWLWSKVDGTPRHFTKGDHFLHIFIHEDGIRLDQLIITPKPIPGGEALRSAFATGEGTAWQAKSTQAVDLSFDLSSMVLSSDPKTECRIVFRRLRKTEGIAKIRAILHEAANGEDATIAEHDLNLSLLPELCSLPLDFSRFDLGKLPRREYLLSAELTLEDKTIAKASVPLMRPYDWEVLGPGRYLSNDTPGPLDADAEITEKIKGNWVPFKDSSYNPFGVLDFGLQVSGNSKHPPKFKTIYARTKISVTESAIYLFKIQSDDQMLLWLDGKLIFRDDFIRPVTRTAFRLPVKIEKGEHTLRMRVNEQDGPWQATLRIRTKKDGVSSVVGLENTAAKATAGKDQ